MIDNENIKDSIEVFCKYRIDPRNGRIEIFSFLGKG